MRGLHLFLTAIVLTASASAHAQARVKPKPKVSAASAQLQAQIKKLTDERDELKDRLAATANLQEDLAAAQKSRDLARQETDGVRKELDQIKSALAENQGSSDTILAELQKTKADLAAAQAANEALRKAAAAGKEKLAAPTGEGALVAITPDIIPARPMNVARVTPGFKKVSRGVIVVNVLVSETGEVLDTRLLQGLPGQGEWVDKANAACVEAARRLVFDPARTADGKARVRVWQGVGFLVD
jgi:seryl-tRNA synthetase